MHNVTVTSVEYVGMVDVPAPTPLNPKATRPQLVDAYRVTFDVEGVVAGYELYFAPEAIGNRQLVYGLETEDEAVVALAREVVFGWDETLAPADTSSVADVNGGADVRIACGFGRAAKQRDRAALYAQHAERIAASREPPSPSSEAAAALAVEPDPPPDAVSPAA